MDQRRAKRDVAQAQLDCARKDLADTVLRAPFSGIVAERHAEQFQNIQPKEDIVTLQSIGTVEASVSVPASLVPRLANGNEASNPYVILSSAPELKIPGRFRSATTQGDTQSQTFQVKFAFTPPPGLVVLPGMTGTVYESRAALESDEDAGKISVPLGAILSDGTKRYVRVVKTKTMVVKKRVVSVDDDVGDDVTLQSGLKAGQTIVRGWRLLFARWDDNSPYKQ